MRARPKSKPDGFLDGVGESLAAVSGSVNWGKLVKTDLIAGGIAAVMTGSAAISSIRRRTEGNEL